MRDTQKTLLRMDATNAPSLLYQTFSSTGVQHRVI